jgi:hypothetical protein
MLHADHRLLPNEDRNISTSLFGTILEGAEPATIDRDQLDAALALLNRQPLAIDRARRLLLCPPLWGPREPPWARACRLRACPRCADRRARALTQRMLDHASGYGERRAVLVTCPSRTLLDLPETLQRMRRGVAKLRRRTWFAKTVVGGVLALEFPLTRDGRRWALHAHGILHLGVGTVEPEWLARLATQWAELAAAPGAIFKLEPLRSTRDLARYALKVGDTKSWSPGGRDLAPSRRVHLDQALRGRRLIVAWGAKRNGQ